MKKSKSSGFNTPFEDLESLLKTKSVPLSTFPVEKVLLNKKIRYENDEALFEAAMVDVLPIDKKNMIELEKLCVRCRIKAILPMIPFLHWKTLYSMEKV
jgi:hypothetical protein